MNKSRPRVYCTDLVVKVEFRVLFTRQTVLLRTGRFRFQFLRAGSEIAGLQFLGASSETGQFQFIWTGSFRAQNSQRLAISESKTTTLSVKGLYKHKGSYRLIIVNYRVPKQL